MSDLALTLLRGAVTSPFKRPARPGATLPPARAVLPPARVSPGRLASYNRICGFGEPAGLPLTYPHVLGFPPAMRVMAGRAFPLPVLGLVHTWIEITGHRAIGPADSPEITVYAGALTPHRRGTEVTMVTEARLDGELVWESRSGYLSRHATRGAAAPSASAAQATTRAGGTGEELPAVAVWQLPGDLGRRYGAASGDRNPIHLHPLTARLFGFPRPIAHGMWTVARCLAEAEAAAPGRIRTVRADFRSPVPLPATVTYAAAGSLFEVRGAGRVHLRGRLTREG
ncbi:MaoC/PaaZ C-terminal domain-containing protein [Streptomyces sp. NPDC005899]|uniref:MaoC family dehydratase n=1 Tax=Streptomyces sp. NPDC005899 TaxID=3155716 RepID=UPI0033D6CA19